MRFYPYAVLLLMLFSSRTVLAQIPQRFQQIILENAPQADLDGDGNVTIEELKQAYPGLPESYQRVIQERLPAIADDAPASKKKSKSEIKFEFDRPAGEPRIGREKGYNCLFMGHSFFCPIVKCIDEHAKSIGLTHHQQFIARSGGATGSPGRLWNSDKPSVLHAKQLLKTGRVELLALTYHFEGSSLEDYRRWVELAVKHNPDTIVVIQAPWSIKLQAKLPEYSEVVTQIIEIVHKRIDRLREAFPSTTFLCVPQGQWMVKLWQMFENGDLAELTQFVGNGKGRSQKALFRDNFGHGGELAETQGALLWLRVLYGFDLESYPYTTNTEADLKAIAQSICDRDPYCQFKIE